MVANSTAASSIAAIVETGCDFMQTSGDVFIRKSVKTVAPDALAIEVFGDCITIGHGTVGTMKGSIEAGDLD